jgi:2OG-Fe(II) oxygenase superfamily
MDLALKDGDRTGEAGNPESVSILGAASPDHVLSQPFSHLVARDVLPAETYGALAARFPSAETILNGRPLQGNAAARIPAAKVLANPAIAPEWRSFFDLHTSERFWADIARVFGPALRASHPDLECKAGKQLEDWRAGPRRSEGEVSEDGLDVRLDCQFVINTPWPTEGAEPPPVKTPHIDKRNTILSALLYFRDPEDDGQGGDLELYSWARPPRFLEHRMIMIEDLELQKQVPYSANTLVVFVNSAQAAHGVTPRGPSRLPRRYINFIVETPFAAFKAPKLRPVERLIYWHRTRAVSLRETGGDRY